MGWIRKRNAPVESILTEAREATRRDDVTVEHLVSALGRSSFQPLLLLAAVAAVSPLSAIPFCSSFCGILIFLISGQLALGREHLWLPRRLAETKVNRRLVRRSFDALISVARWIDSHSRPRFRPFQHPPFSTGAYIFCAMCGAMMPFLEFIPMSASILASVVVLLSLGMLTRDGLYGLAAAVASVLIFVGAFTVATA